MDTSYTAMEHQDNKAEFVRSIWSRLGVGHDGYLSLADLTKVCHAIGMENNAKELFSRLDLDGDGRISFAEFLHLFQKGVSESISPTSSEPSDSSSSTSAPLPAQELKRKSPAVGASSGTTLRSSLEDDIASGSVIPLLLPPEPASTVASSSRKSVSVWRVLQQWESYGISDGRTLLQELGLPHSPNDQLVMQDLLSAVDEECSGAASAGSSIFSSKRQPDTNNYRRALCMLLLQETKYLRSAVENAWGERDKFRSDLTLTSQRLSNQAQELDDHTTALEITATQHIQSVEKQHNEAVRSLQERLSSEREAREQASVALSDVTLKADHLQEQLNKLKVRLADSEKACERIDSENSELNSKLESATATLTDAQNLNALLQQQGAGCNSSRGEAEEAEWREVLSQLNRIRLENQSLRDTNDELLARIDHLTLHQPFSMAAHHLNSTSHNMHFGAADISYDGSCMGDYMASGPGNISINSTSLSTTTSADVYSSQKPLTSVLGCPSNEPSSHLSTNNNANNSINSCSGNNAGVKRGAVSDDESQSSSPRDVSSSGRRGSPDLLSPRAGKIARCASSPPPPTSSHHISNNSSNAMTPPGGNITSTDISCDVSHRQQQFYTSCSQPASLDLHLSSISSGWSRPPNGRRVASTNSVVTSGGLSGSSGSISPSVSAPHSARRGRGLGLEAELAGVRVEVAGLVQQRDQLASCVASLQLRHDAQLTRWSAWESVLRKLIGEVEKGSRVTIDISPSTTVEDFNSTAKEITGNTAQTTTTHDSAWVSGNSSDLIKDLVGEIMIDNKNSPIEGDVHCLPGQDDVQSEGDAVSEVSSTFQDSPRKPPADLAPLLTSLQTALQRLQQSEADRRCRLQTDLLCVEREKAELQDRYNAQDIELQAAKSELDKIEEYWLLKLQEEQDYYEEERKVYDDNFSKLQSKISEYEAETNDSNKRLTPIDEAAMFELQVNTLETEVSEMLEQVEQAEDDKDSALQQLKDAQLQLSDVQTRLDITSHEMTAMKKQLSRNELIGTKDGITTVKKQSLSVNEQVINAKDCNSIEKTAGEGTEEEGVSAYRCPCSGGGNGEQLQGVMRYLHESCKQLHSAQHTATTTRQGLEVLQDELKHQLDGLTTEKTTAATTGNDDTSKEICQMVPASALVALLKNCREQQRAQVTQLEESLASAHHHLHHHAAQHTTQVHRANRADKLLARLYIENAELMRSLQVTEHRQKQAEHKLRLLAPPTAAHRSC